MPGAEVHKGLAGVVVDTTAVSEVVAATSTLTYRGYPVQELAARCSIEQVALLLWHGQLPDAAQLAAFEQRERAQREIPPGVRAVLAALPQGCHPMDVLRTAVSALGAERGGEPAPEQGSPGPEQLLAASEALFAVLPTVVAADARRRRGLVPVDPDPSLGYVANFFAMCTGSVPAPEVLRAFEVSLVLYAEHSFNASTFTARVIASTLSDLHSAVTGAIGALKGPLHGGANEAVMRMMEEIGEPELAADWLRAALASRRKVMGFGHRVYKDGDSRVPTMRAAFEDLAARTPGGARWTAMYAELERTMLEEKGIHPNLDFPAGPAYHLMGFETELFTSFFVMARVVGWTAHVVEQLGANALIRPLSRYTGEPPRPVPDPLPA